MVEPRPGGGRRGAGLQLHAFCGVGESVELLAAAEGVEARPADLTADIDADGAVADGADVELGALDVGLELLGEEVAQLLDGEPLDVEGA